MVDEASAQSFAVSGIFAREQYVGVPHLVDVRRTHSKLIKLFEGNQHEPFAVFCNSSINTRGGPIWIFFRHTGLNAVERQSCCPSECAQRFWIVQFVHVADVLTDGDDCVLFRLRSSVGSWLRHPQEHAPQHHHQRGAISRAIITPRPLSYHHSQASKPRTPSACPYNTFFGICRSQCQSFKRLSRGHAPKHNERNEQNKVVARGGASTQAPGMGRGGHTSKKATPQIFSNLLQ